MSAELEDTYLNKACKAIRDILQANAYIIEKCQDALKDPSFDFILDEALELRHLVRNYTCSVYHTNKEVVINEDLNFDNTIGVVYIDFHHKKNKKEGSNRYELDIFGRSILKILRGNWTLNGSVEGWKFKQKDLWQINQSVSKSDKMPEEKILDYIGTITLHVLYTESFHNYIDG